jgi:uncharacterized protein (TIGR03437 family)
VRNLTRQYFLCALTAMTAVCVPSVLMAQGPAWDQTGNNLLNGSFNFRQVSYAAANASGDLASGRALFGTIAFDGQGHYTMPGATLITKTQSGTASQQIPAVSGTYSIAVNGYGFLSGIFCLAGSCPGGRIYVLVAQGMMVGSSPEQNVNDVFVAAPVATTQNVTTAFQGAWTMAGIIPSVGASAGLSADTFFPLTPDGAGHLGTVNLSGYFGVNGATPTLQTAANVTYAVNGGAATIAWPANFYYNGAETLYFSPDGTFCFGGSPNSPDLLVGVRSPAPGSTQTLSGIWYDGGFDQNQYFLSQGYVEFDTYYGAFNASGSRFVEADRMQNGVFGGATSSNTTYLNPGNITSGTYTIPNTVQYAVNGSATVRIGSGIWPTLGINIAFKAPVFSGGGVYLDPNGVVNAGSFAPFTTGISAGEIVVLFGSNLAAATASASTLPLPTALGNVKVTFNGIAAPLFYVSAGQISAMVPSGVTGPVVQVQVTNNSTPSNVVDQFVYTTSPALFTIPSDGVSLGAVEHANGSLVSEASPAVPGETLQAFLTGLGPVNPPVADGAAASASPLSQATTTFTVYVGWAKCAVTFAGLVPTLAGVYQVNVQLPAVVPNGDQFFEIDGPDSASTQGIIPVLSGTSSQQPPAPTK